MPTNGVPEPSPTTRRIPRRALPLLVIGVVGVGLLGLLRPSGPPVVQPGTPPGSYAITYLVEDLLSDPVVESEQRLVVQRPFRSDLIQERDGELVSRTLTGLDAVSQQGSPETPSLVQPRLPTIPPGDLRLDVVLDVAIADGSVIDEGTTTELLGRACRWVASGAPLDAGRWTPPTDDDITRTCVDGAGLILQEEVTFSDRPARRRTATALELDAVPDLHEPPAPPDDGDGPPSLGGVAEVALLDELPEESLTSLLAPDPPEGFALDVIAGYREADPLSGQPIAALGRRLVFRDGIDVVYLDERRSLDGREPELPDGPLVDGGVVGDLAAQVDGAGTTLIGSLDGARILIGGTIPADDLLAWVQTFRTAGS